MFSPFLCTPGFRPPLVIAISDHARRVLAIRTLPVAQYPDVALRR